MRGVGEWLSFAVVVALVVAIVIYRLRTPWDKQVIKLEPKKQHSACDDPLCLCRSKPGSSCDSPLGKDRRYR